MRALPSTHDIRRSRVAVSVALALALAGSSAAVAADLKVIDGILQFPNVRVVAAPQGAQPLAGPQGGLRAYKDSATGELRGPTTEEMQAASTSSNLRRSSTTDASIPASDSTSFAANGGGVGVVLDDSSLQYSVVVRQADGSLAEICVSGRDAADEIVRNPSAAKSIARKETSHVR